MSEEKRFFELDDDSLEEVTGGGDLVDCDWGGEVKYTLELGHAYARNNALNYVYVPIAHVSGPKSGNSFHVFTCNYYEFGSKKDTHDVSFGKNDIITEVFGNYQ